MFNKFAVLIAFAVCTTNAWAKMCEKQEIKELNNDKYLYFKADTADLPMIGFVCGGECADGSKIISVDIQGYIAGNWLGTSGGSAGSQGYWTASRCSDRKIDSKWETFSDLRNEFKECTDAQRSEYSALKKEGSQRTEGGAVRIYCKKVESGRVGGTYCVSSDPNNETICWVDRDEDDQKQVVAVPLTPPEEETPETETDCGNVGQWECDGDYKFYVCETDADCGSEHLPSHATAGHCVSAGRSGYKVCTATNCGENYELARDKKGNSMGWCRKKTAQGNVFNITLKNGQKINNLFAVDFMYADDTGKVYGIITYVDDTPSSDVYFEMGDVSRIDDKDVSSFLSGAKTGHIDSTSWYIYECDTKNGYIAAEQIDVRDKLQLWQILSNPECGASSSVGIQCENIPFYKKCVKKSNNGESESETTSATVFDDLDKFISEKFVGSSVWKNDEGNFNTARLVSDSVAGVVLGTVGGVITSHIIKKNQIENGFDDLKCTIGGQTVASYGDEFRVGVK